MYIRKSIAEFLEKMPFDMKMPNHWRKFVKDNDVPYNLIIKHGKECECTNCGKYFYKEYIEGTKTICPFCNNTYNVRRSNLKNYFFLYDLAVIDNIDNKVVVRYFEVRRDYNYKIRRFKDSVVEYARIIPELDLELASDRFVKYMGFEKVYHTKKNKKWRIFTGQYGLAQNYKSIYLENLNEKLKGTIYEYALLTEAIKYLNNDRVNFIRLLEIAKLPSFELLMKLGLYKLALNCPDKFNVKGNFVRRFGISKEYYKFMKKHNIDSDELMVLKIIKRPNITIIRDILKLSDYFKEDIENAAQYVDLIKLRKYSKKQKNFSLHNYLDYIRNLRNLDIPLTKKTLFPDNLEEAHNESVEKVAVLDKHTIREKIKQRYNELQKNKFKNNIYLIRPARSLEDMRDEAKQQSNCVYKNYSDKYAFGETDIYFMREVNNPKKSLVTIEVKKGRIRQNYQKRNMIVTKEQSEFLKEWEEKILKAA